jgi:hypothetical protein
VFDRHRVHAALREVRDELRDVQARAPELVWPREIEGHSITDTKTLYRRLKPKATIMRFEVPTLPRSVKEPQVDYGFGADIEFEGKAGNPPVPLLMPHEFVWYVLAASSAPSATA